MFNPDHTGTPAATDCATVYLAFELSKATWKLGLLLPGSQKLSRYSIPGGDLKALTERLTMAHNKAASCGKLVRIVSCYEAGFDAHWLHRWLTDQGVTNYEVDPASIAVNRRARRAKTDPHRSRPTHAHAVGLFARRTAGLQRGARAGGRR